MKSSSLVALVLISCCCLASAQSDKPYLPHSSLSVFAEYSNTSSHILLGVSQNRRLAGAGVTYSRHLLHTTHFDWYYDLDLRPLVFIQEPTRTQSFTISGPPGPFRPSRFSGPIQRACTSSTATGPLPPPATGDYTFTQTCSTRWTWAGGLSPLGQRLNFRTGHRLQPFALGNAGFLVATRDVPSNDSSNFNFTFEFGAGLQLFRTPRNSWSADYRLHHLSNDYTGHFNPGIDSQILRLTYCFGR